MSDPNDKSIKVIAFDGEKKNWLRWVDKFLAAAQHRGYRALLTGAEMAPAEDVDVSKDATKAKLRRANEIGYADLILACDGMAFDIVKQAKTKDLPNGDVREAWKNLNKKYQANTASQRVSVKGEFGRCEMQDPSEDPDKWFGELQCLRSRLLELTVTLDDQDVTDHILNCLPKE